MAHAKADVHDKQRDISDKRKTDPGYRKLDKLLLLTILLVIMNPRRPLELVYAPQVRDHLKAIEPKYYGLIRQEIEAQLQFEPETQTGNRKPLKRAVAFEAEWEMRFGPNNQFRVFYEVDREAEAVYILAIGVKDRDRLYIGGEEVG